MKTKLIFSPQLAQYLLHHRLVVIELKLKRGAINETVFVFKYEEQMDKLIKEQLNTALFKLEICCLMVITIY